MLLSTLSLVMMDFSLYDLYSYNHKHNEANGWNNTDGSDDNRSWNCGAEGDTKDALILKLRYRMIKNAFSVLMCSRGTPMFLSGDEFCDTRFGNNNPYCQDNLTSWLDWKLLDTHRDIFEFCKYMIHFRHNHPAIRKSIAQSHCGFPPISQHGVTPWDDNFTQDSKIVCTMFAGHDAKTGLGRHCLPRCQSLLGVHSHPFAKASKTAAMASCCGHLPVRH